MLTIYKASAGSGKTYQLAKEYIRNLIGVKPEGSTKYYLNLPKYNNGISEASNRHRFILAITFTNKATDEMKRRIIDELDHLAQIPVHGATSDANYAKDFCKDFGCTRLELAEASAKALRQLLNDYNQFNVTTIDSFFQRVLRTFAREVERQGDFAVELNDNSAVQTAVGLMLNEYNNNESTNAELGSWIYNYMLRQINKGAKTNFFNRKSQLYTTLISLVSKICEERFKPYSNMMTEYLADPKNIALTKKAITDLQKGLITRVKQVTDYTMDLLDKNGVTLDQMKATYSTVRRLITERFSQGVAADADYLFDETFTKMASGQTDFFLKKYKVSPSDFDLFVSMLAQIRELYTKHEILADIYESIDQLALLRHAWQYLLLFMNENNTVLLSDTNHLLERIIGDDDTPFIYERMGVQFRNFLIDEFQDTSKMQWRNLKPLVANGLSNDNNSLIIGDEKQSIYRFRNSDSSLLHSQVSEHDFTSDLTEIRGTAEGENTNYRSADLIVRFNNTFFKHLASMRHIEGFENVVQEVAPKNKSISGYIRFLPFETKPKKDYDADEGDVLDAMAENIRAQHDLGGYAWSDIAILVAKNDEGGEAVERLINKYPDIPVLSDEALFVRKSHAVQLIIGILKILATEQPSKPGDKAGKIKINKYPTPTEISIAISRFGFFRDKGLSDTDAIECAINPEKSADHVLLNYVESIKARKPASLVALVETIIHEIVPEKERQSQISFLNAFQDYVVEFSSRNNPSLRALLNDWESAKHKLSVSSGANVDAVKVMTIHKSKGLEFACVHIPFGSWKEVGGQRGQWMEFPSSLGLDPKICPPTIYLTFDKKYSNPGSYFIKEYESDEQERRVDVMNMTYVAYTRAGRELTVYYDPTKGIGPTIAETLAIQSEADRCLCDLGSCYDSETCTFVMGEPTHKSTESHASDDSEDACDTICLDDYDVYYHSGAEVLTKLDDMLDYKADIDGSDTDNDAFEIDEEARQRGIILHDILAHIYVLDDIEGAIHRVALSRRIDQKQCDEAKAFLLDMLDTGDQRIARWFVDNDNVLNEQSILLPDEYRTPHSPEGEDEADFRRPDRIVFCDGHIEVIDYKFTTEVRSKHKRQIREYIYLLQRMGYNDVRGYLWYPFQNKIIDIQ